MYNLTCRESKTLSSQVQEISLKQKQSNSKRGISSEVCMLYFESCQRKRTIISNICEVEQVLYQTSKWSSYIDNLDSQKQQ